MFDYISGELNFLSQNQCVVDTHGVGWSFLISAKSAAQFSGKKQVKVYTYLNIGSADRASMELYGFATQSEREFFILLISVSGIGPKAAISVLSALSPEELSLSILSGDAKSITVAQGIGLKGAQKIILELKDKIGKTAVSAGVDGIVHSEGVSGTDLSEAINALVVLGYSPQVASSAVRSVSKTAGSLQEMIRLALKSIGESEK